MTSEARTSPPDLQVRRVLVPLDGSEVALRAMPTACALADRFGAELQTVSAAGADDDAARLRALASAALGVDPGDDRRVEVAEGDPAEVIARRAEMQRALLGAAAASIVHASVAPCLVAPVRA